MQTKGAKVNFFSKDSNERTVNFLNTILANEYVLFTKTLNYHWNFKGPRFTSMHKFLEEHYKQLLEIMDKTAERVKIIGGHPLSTAKEMSDETMLQEKPGEIPSSNQMITILLKDHHTIKNLIRTKISDENIFSRDPGTEDMLTGILREHEKMSWMLESNLS